MIPLIVSSGAVAAGGGGVSAGYPIAKSLRLRGVATASLSRTPTSVGSQTTYTISMWARRGRAGVVDELIGADVSGFNYMLMGFGSISNGGDALEVGWALSNGIQARLLTTAVFRDTTAWMHVVLVVDTTNAVQTDRVRIFVNGVRITAFTYAFYPAQGSTLGFWNAASQPHYIGRYNAGGQTYDGNLAEIIHVDGQALDATNFGQFDVSTGAWRPIAYGGTFGTNGFYLPFTSATTAATLVADASGRGNNFTPANISVAAGPTFDQSNDTPTNTFPTLSPTHQNLVISAGALRGNAGAAVTGTGFAVATMAIATGKWIFEWTIESITGPGGYLAGPGLVPVGATINRSGAQLIGDANLGWGFGVTWSALSRRFNGANTTIAGSGGAGGVTISLLVDMDTGSAWLARDGVIVGGGDPVAGTSPLITGITGPVFPAFQTYYDASNALPFNVNFGQRPMVMTATGFQPICTQNLPTPRVVKPSLMFDAVPWIGTGANQVVTLGLSPDLVWAKRRNVADNHALYDRTRGLNKELVPNSNVNEAITANGLDAFTTPNRLSLTGSAYFGGGAGGSPPFVAWLMRDLPAAGLDIVTYTGTGANATIPHDLGAAPGLMLIKSRTASGVSNWVAYHKDQLASPATAYMLLNGTQIPAVSATIWNNTAPGSSSFTVGANAAVNELGSTYVAYLFAEVPAFSRLAKYVGNGSADGPFVWCGFRPRFVMIKRVDAVGNWNLLDAARDPANVAGQVLFPNLANIETLQSGIDLMANGFKLRGTQADWNAAGASYVFLAIAETPVKYSLAR